jgi:hypothetical protein
MFFKNSEHNPPHIHADYAGKEIVVEIKTGKTRGTFPVDGKNLVLKWVKKHQKELLKMWETGEIKELPPL